MSSLDRLGTTGIARVSGGTAVYCWPKRCSVLGLVEARCVGIRNVTQTWPESILFGQAGFIILRGSGRGQASEMLPR
jgi:hypothetical protein